MPEDQAPSSTGAPAPSTLGAISLCSFLPGLALGIAQPIVYVSVMPFFAGPTYVGLLFLLSILVGLVTLFLAFFGARWLTVPAFMASGALALGVFAGNWTAVTFDVGFGANRPAALAPPTFAPRSPPSFAASLAPAVAASLPARSPEPGPPSGPAPNVGTEVAKHLAAYHAEILSATRALPREVPAGRTTVEPLDAYGARAQMAANDAAAPIRELVRRELTWLASLDEASCPLTGRYRVLLNSHAILAGSIWTAFYAPDPELRRQAVSDLDALDASVAAALRALSGSPAPCEVPLDAIPTILPNAVVGTQAIDIRRDPDRLHESALGNLIADAMRLRYPNVDAAFMNSGGLRADLVVSPPSAGEQAGEITRGEMLTVLPFGNRIVILTVTRRQLEGSLVNGLAPACDPRLGGGTGRFPQLSGLRVGFHCDGTTPVVDEMWKTPGGSSGPATPIGAAEATRIVTLDYLLAGGDGYSMFDAGTDVQQPGDTLLQVAVDHVATRSPVASTVDGRILGR